MADRNQSFRFNPKFIPGPRSGFGSLSSTVSVHHTTHKLLIPFSK